ncbi:Kinesin-like protein [Aphelenchoides fujianensis]|nr:Kinesin-like protein [Aphelenchoides fujianensis]
MTETDNVKVVVRCRPLSAQEIQQGHRSAVQVDKIAKTVSVRTSINEITKSYTFDDVFDWDSNQITIYNSVARPIIENVLKGIQRFVPASTIFAYGQTGTGKTYTMSGGDSKAEERGIIPNSFAHIFDHISKCKQDKTFLVHLQRRKSAICWPKNQKHGLEIKERPDIGVFVKDLSSVTVSSADHMYKIMQFGNINRHIGATNMNEQSSRSHALFTVTIECSEKINNHQHLTQGKLHLVDLAGSERQTKTGASGERLKEASKINLSLSTLGNVISALVDAKATHIPYRNSKLTRLLQDSLGGNSKTVMVANIGPATYNYDETISTLRYANRAKNIKNVARINEDPKDALLRKFQQEIEQLRKQLENEDGSGESEDEDAEVDGDRERPQHTHWDEKIREMEQDIAERRKKLDEERGMAEGERRRLADELLRKEQELAHSKSEHEKLTNKLAAIERKLIVGGENMLEKAEKQAQLLEQSNVELERARHNESQLRKRLETRQAERLDIEEKYNTLQEEVNVKTKRLKRAFTNYVQAKAELEDIESEHQREMEGLLENVRQLQKELKLYISLISAYIPDTYVDLIEKYVCWNDENGEWQLKCIAYTGNNMRVAKPVEPFVGRVNEPQMRPVYLSYSNYVDTPVQPPINNGNRPFFRPKSAMKDRQAAKIKALLE